MKKRLFIVLLFLSSSVFYSQSKWEVSGQIRPRLQVVDKDFNSDISSINFTELRTRVGVKFLPTSKLTGFIQLQDSRVYGTEPNTLSNTSNIDLHQAYFKLNQLFDLPINIQLGRFELSYGPQRLIGAVGWHNVGRSFDGGVIQLSSNKANFDFFMLKTNESFNVNDTNDFSVAGIYSDLKIVKNYKIQPFIIAEMESGTDFGRYTLGFYINGNLRKLSHEVEAAYQFGSLNESVDIAAYMFALNLKYNFGKPSLGAGIDLLSGNDLMDAENYQAFSTLYATNHKYYGFMDYFLNIPNSTYGAGLVDIHLKGEIKLIEKLKTSVAFHIFNSSKEVTLPDNKKSNSFGSEFDLTLAYKYSSLVKFQGGFSFFSPGEIFKQRKGEDSSTWVYLMAVVNF